MVKMQSQIVFLKKFETNGENIGTAKSSRPYPRRRPKIADQRKQVKDQDLQNILVAPKRPSNILYLVKVFFQFNFVVNFVYAKNTNHIKICHVHNLLILFIFRRLS